MSRTKTLWIGWLCLIVNGYEVLSGLVTGRMGGLATIGNPDNPPSYADRPGTFVLFLLFYLALSGLGVHLIFKGHGMEQPR